MRSRTPKRTDEEAWWGILTGEILVTVAAAEAAGLETAGLESRTLTVRGRDEPVVASGGARLTGYVSRR